VSDRFRNSAEALEKLTWYFDRNDWVFPDQAYEQIVLSTSLGSSIAHLPRSGLR
jgi:hypothetical protein